jgi:hypothetical protein
MIRKGVVLAFCLYLLTGCALNSETKTTLGHAYKQPVNKLGSVVKCLSKPDGGVKAKSSPLGSEGW